MIKPFLLLILICCSHTLIRRAADYFVEYSYAIMINLGSLGLLGLLFIHMMIGE